ncbi:uncharacterized protein LOC125646122 [Ostrea edulis]|uniref:uncharacterized protein LOC125646122 n=1 Tax=Ostrea edulis TaxID=37623 RepID=UPI002095E843|nr:uncharacterized protein LOC125646122 [Ostrea edulis]
MAPFSMKEIVSLCILSVFVLIETCHAHLCLISPAQRGSLAGINKAGNDNCFQVKGPCGKMPPSKDGVIIRPGQTLSVTFQKNLDHFLGSSPGNFTVAFGSVSDGKFQLLTTIPDQGEKSLTLYTAVVKIPLVKGNYAIQVTYNTNNPGAPPSFYQCADVVVQNL